MNTTKNILDLYNSIPLGVPSPEWENELKNKIKRFKTPSKKNMPTIKIAGLVIFFLLLNLGATYIVKSKTERLEGKSIAAAILIQTSSSNY